MATQLTLSDLTEDFDEFVAQFEQHAINKDAWRGNLTIQTSQTLIEFGAAIGTYIQGQVRRAAEDNFPETAQSDQALRANATQQGIRLTRKMPATLEVEFTSPVPVTIPAYSQFSQGGLWFNRDPVVLDGVNPTLFTLYQGEVLVKRINGLGTDFQSYVAPEDSFVISDRDVQVTVNGTLIPKAYNAALWNYRGEWAYADLTLPDGRLIVQFGTALFGLVPDVNDIIDVQYVITNGAQSNSLALIGRRIGPNSYPTVEGRVLSNPTGGADERNPVAYKNVIAGAFGTYESATTRNQYVTTVGNYPGVIDAVTQAQREVNPAALQWMNVIRVSALTASPWSQAQIDDFIDYMQSVTMYAPRFVWQNPIPMPRDLELEVYVFNGANVAQLEADVRAALQAFFSPRRGILQTDYYQTDISHVVRQACKGQMAYMMDFSDYPMRVGMPPSPRTRFTIQPGAGSLPQLVYAYSIGVTLDNGDVGMPTSWVTPAVTVDGSAIYLEWDPVANATMYTVYGRSSLGLGQIMNVVAPLTNWTDNGTHTPITPLPTAADFPIRYNTLNNLNLRILPAKRQQRVF